MTVEEEVGVMDGGTDDDDDDDDDDDRFRLFFLVCVVVSSLPSSREAGLASLRSDEGKSVKLHPGRSSSLTTILCSCGVIEVVRM